MDNWSQLMICAVLGIAVSYGIIVLILEGTRRRWIPERHTEFHHTHAPTEIPIPRLGGIALAAAYLAILLIPLHFFQTVRWLPVRWIIAGTTFAMFGLGLWDDIRPLGAKIKLGGQLLIASTAYFLGLGIHQFKIPFTGQIIELGFASWAVTVFWLVAMTNLINLTDGVDGLAGGISLMLMILLTALSDPTSAAPYIAAGIGGALLAFLRFNFAPAKIYLGDGGAYFLGYLIGCLTIFDSQKGTVAAALIAPLFVLALPIMDTSLAILRRGLHGLPLFRADRRHLHHRLLSSGLSRRQLVLGAYLFTAFFLGLGLLIFWWDGQHLALLFGCATLVVLALACRFEFTREWLAILPAMNRCLSSRREIQYALAHSKWLAMEGARSNDITTVCEDTAYIARKLGFGLMHIRLEDSERTWELIPCANRNKCSAKATKSDSTLTLNHPTGSCHCIKYRRTLPGHATCYLELQTIHPDALMSEEEEDSKDTQPHLTVPAKYEILADVLAEGWIKSVTQIVRNNQVPVRFYPNPQLIGEVRRKEKANA